MHLRLLPAAAVLLASSIVAHADTVFNLQGTFNNGATLGGTVTLNSASTAFSAVDATISGGSGPSEQFTIIANQGQESIFSDYYLSLYSGTAYLFPDFATSSLAGYNGSLICSANSPCNGDETFAGYNSDSEIFLSSGSVTPQTNSITPEPSSIALLGTGMLGVAGVVRKRFV